MSTPYNLVSEYGGEIGVLLGETIIVHVESSVIHDGQERSEKKKLQARERFQGVWGGKLRDPTEFLKWKDWDHLLVSF